MGITYFTAFPPVFSKDLMRPNMIFSSAFQQLHEARYVEGW